MNPAVVKQGWLEKRGEHLRLWSKRYLVLYEDGTLNGYKEQPLQEDVIILKGKLENRFNVRNVSIIRLDDGLNFKIRCRQQSTLPNDNSSIERSFRSIQNRADRDDWCDKIETICSQNRSHRSSVGSAEMAVDINQPGGQGDSTEPEDIEMPMAPELKTASQKLTMDSFERIKVLGKGTFGSVYLVYLKSDVTRKRMAMKVVKKQKVRELEELDHMRNEREVLGSTDHRFLIKLFHAFQTSTQLCFVMEFAQGGEIYTMLAQTNTFPLKRCRFYGAEITCAFEYLHGKQIIYRDLKLENILLAEDGHIKVADFGLCKYLSTPERTTQTFCGTPEYLAPEVLRDENYDDAVDWWSLGVVLHEMIVGKLPFNHNNQDILFDQIILHPLPEIPTHVPDDAVQFLTGLLQKEAHQRLGAGERDALDVMEHPFFASIDFEKLRRGEIEPPYKPQLRDSDDTTGFGPEFTSMPVDSYDRRPESFTNQEEFVGFSFNNRNQTEHSHNG